MEHLPNGFRDYLVDSNWASDQADELASSLQLASCKLKIPSLHWGEDWALAPTGPGPVLGNSDADDPDGGRTAGRCCEGTASSGAVGLRDLYHEERQAQETAPREELQPPIWA